MNTKENAYIHFMDGKPWGYPEAVPTVKECKGFLDFMDFHCKWQQSGTAIKEPGFKDVDIGVTYYFNGANGNEPYTVKTIDGSGNVTLHDKEHIERIYTNINDFDKRFSHYHEGQEIPLEKFRYVKKSRIIGTDAVGDHVDITEWQEVKEPEKYIENHQMNNLHTKDQFLPNPEWEQFQKGKREGTILLEETT